MARVTLPTEEISDWDSFHSVCQKVFGFPAFYGRNMDAWIDCLTYVDEGDGMSAVVLGQDETLNIEIADALAFRERVPEIFAALLDSTAFVNRRSLAAAKQPRLALVLC